MIYRSGEIYAKYETENGSQEEHQESRSRRQKRPHCCSHAHGDSHCVGSGGARAARRKRK